MNCDENGLSYLIGEMECFCAVERPSYRSNGVTYSIPLFIFFCSDRITTDRHTLKKYRKVQVNKKLVHFKKHSVFLFHDLNLIFDDLRSQANG